MSGNVFVNPAASSAAPYPEELNPWVLKNQNQFTHHRRGRITIKHQFRIRDVSLDRQPEIQSSLVREIFETITEQANNDCQASSSALYPQELNSSRKKTIEEPIHMFIAEKSGRPERDSDLRCQSGPSAKNSVIFSGGDSSKNYGADQQRLQISDLHFDKFPTPATFACWKIRFKTEVCTCSQFPTEAMQSINEMWLVDSVDELRSSSSTRGISMPNFESTWCEDCFGAEQNHHNSHFKRKIGLEEQKAQKEDRFLRGRQIAYLIYEQFRVTGANDSVKNYADLFTIVLRNDDIQEFDSKWDGILLSMTKIPPDDILEGLYKLRIRGVLRNSRPYWNCTTWRLIRRSWDLIVTDWKLWWREVSSKKFEIRILGAEMEILRRTLWLRIRDKTACTKHSWRFLAMGSQWAVCERRQMQFPPRYE